MASLHQKKKKKNLQEGNCRELRVRRANWLDIKAESPKSNSLWERKEKKKKNWYCLRPYQQASNGSGFFCFNHEHGQVERWRMLARWNQSIGGRARVCSKGRSIYRDWYIYTCTTANIYVRVCKRKGKGKKRRQQQQQQNGSSRRSRRGALTSSFSMVLPHTESLSCFWSNQLFFLYRRRKCGESTCQPPSALHDSPDGDVIKKKHSLRKEEESFLLCDI